MLASRPPACPSAPCASAPRYKLALIAAREAAADFAITPKERNIIEAHMWPLPPTRLPRSREAWLVCAADKCCSLRETLFERYRGKG